MIILDTHIKGRGKKEVIEVTVYNPYTQKFSKITKPIQGDHPITGQLRNIEPFSMTGPMNAPSATDLRTNIKESFNVKTISIFDKNYNIVAFGNREELKKLPAYFEIGAPTNVKPQQRKSGISTSKWMSFSTGVPFGTIQETKEKRFYIGEKINIDDFMALKTIAFDSEWMYWEKKVFLEDLRNPSEDIRKFIRKYPDFDNGNLSSESKPGLVKIVENIINKKISQNIGDIPDKIKQRADERFDEKPMMFQISEGTGHHQNVTCIGFLEGEDILETNINVNDFHFQTQSVIGKNANDIVNILSEYFSREKPIIIVTQNGMKYDFLKTRYYAEEQRKKGKNVKFEINGETPKILNSSGFYPTVKTPTIIHIDMAAYFQNYMPLSRSNKFEDIMNMLLYYPIKKSQSYDDLSKLSIEQLIGYPEAERDLRVYGSVDVVAINHVQEWFKKLVYYKSILFNASPEEICTVSKRNLGLNAFEMKMAIRKKRHLYWSIEDVNNYNDLDVSKIFKNLIGKNANKILDYKVQKKFTEGAMYYVAPFTYAYQKFLKKNPDVKIILDYIDGYLQNRIDKGQNNKDLLTVFDLLNTLETGYLAPYVMEDNKQDFTNAKRRFGLDKSISNFVDLIKNHEIINHSDNFFIFPYEEVQKKEFQERINKIGCLVVSGKMINIDKEVFVMNDGSAFYKQKIDMRGIVGSKTIYQKELIQNTFETLFDYKNGGPEKALLEINEFFNNLTHQNIDRRKLIKFKESITRDYDDFSAPAQRNNIIQAYIELELMEGDTFEHIHLSNGWVRLDDFLKMSDEEVFSYDNLEIIKGDYLEKLYHIIEPLMASCKLNPKIDGADISYLINGHISKIMK